MPRTDHVPAALRLNQTIRCAVVVDCCSQDVVLVRVQHEVSPPVLDDRNMARSRTRPTTQFVLSNQCCRRNTWRAPCEENHHTRATGNMSARAVAVPDSTMRSFAADVPRTDPSGPWRWDFLSPSSPRRRYAAERASGHVKMLLATIPDCMKRSLLFERNPTKDSHCQVQPPLPPPRVEVEWRGRV